MKYVDLKNSLRSKIENIYVISGEDRYLCFDALKKIEDACAITIKDMNSVTISGEEVSAKDIVDSANIYPFGDQFRLIVVKNFSVKKENEKQEMKVLSEYANAPLPSTILVFFCPEKNEIFKAMSHITPVDCAKIEPKYISAFIKNRLAKNEISSSEEAVNKLITYCSGDMTRVANELEKLEAYTLETKTLTTDIVEKFVVQDREYQVYELAQLIAKGDAKSAIDLVDSFIIKPGRSPALLSPLYNNYRRALYLSVNKDKTVSEIASALGDKEYTIKMLSSQVQIFSSKKLKQIVDMIKEFDRKIKVGEIKENIAIKVIVFNILNLRGSNG